MDPGRIQDLRRRGFPGFVVCFVATMVEETWTYQLLGGFVEVALLKIAKTAARGRATKQRHSAATGRGSLPIGRISDECSGRGEHPCAGCFASDLRGLALSPSGRSLLIPPGVAFLLVRDGESVPGLEPGGEEPPTRRTSLSMRRIGGP